MIRTKEGENRMDNEKLNEIRQEIKNKKALQERLERAKVQLEEARREEEAFLHKLQKESKDVEVLQKESFSALLFKLISKYEDKLAKEQQEMLEAKWAYDQKVQYVKDVREDVAQLQERIALIRNDEEQYNEELKCREARLSLDKDSPFYATYDAFEKKENELGKQIFEINEALAEGKAARRIGETAESLLDSAHNWATYDAFAKGGILSHMAKYDKIDSAQEAINQLQNQLARFTRELKDVENIYLEGSFGIDTGTRVVDFWFDNIFTDLNVRSKIASDRDRVAELINRVENALHKLNEKKNSLSHELEQIKNQKEELLVKQMGN